MREISRHTSYTLYMHRLNVAAFVRSGRSADDIAIISYATKKRFGLLIDQACAFQVHNLQPSMLLNKTIIDNIDKLAFEIARHALENHKKTLFLFEQAIRINNSFSAYLLHHPEMPYQYRLNLGKLLPQNMTVNGLQKADAFIENYDPKAYFNFLRETGALKRIYDSPISTYTRETKNQYGWSRSDVKGLTEYWFEEPIRNTQIANVQLNFDGFPITLSDLAAKLYENKLLEDGQAFRLFKAAISCAATISSLNKEKSLQFVLDLGSLVPKHLKNINISGKMIDDFIDDPEHYADFLLKTGALTWTEKMDKKTA